MDAQSSSTDTTSAPREAALAGSAPKAIIKNVDMSEEMQQESVDIASAALEKYNIEKDIAAQIKKEFDRRHGPTWHVVVGKNFGSYVTHGTSCLPSLLPSCRIVEQQTRSSERVFCQLQPSIGHKSKNISSFLVPLCPNHETDVLLLGSAETKHFIYFYVGTLAILIWKS